MGPQWGGAPSLTDQTTTRWEGLLRMNGCERLHAALAEHVLGETGRPTRCMDPGLMHNELRLFWARKLQCCGALWSSSCYSSCTMASNYVLLAETLRQPPICHMVSLHFRSSCIAACASLLPNLENWFGYPILCEHLAFDADPA